MRTMKKIVALVMAMAMVVGSNMTVFAAGWQQNATGWWWQNDDGSWPANSWQWLDGNRDGVAECYYFDGNGYMLANTTTPDGYTVNADGAWTVNGVVQTQGVASGNTGVNHGANYDPAHPLANAPASWNLKLTPDKNMLNYNYICSNDNIHAMLTGQMEYYHVRTGYDSDRQNAEEQALYQWFCDWLNGMDFEHMSEMDKAKEIQKVLFPCKYELGSEKRNMYYTVLINKKGYCSEFAMTATSLATVLGLKSEISGSGTHAIYYIYVDGVKYGGQNQGIDLDTPVQEDYRWNGAQ